MRFRRSTAGVMGRVVAPSRRAPSASAPAERGFVLLETALAIPLLLAVAVALAWAVSLGATSMALGDAARQAAREIARGVPASTAIEGARAVAPGARLQMVDDGGSIEVVAEQDVAAPVPVLRGVSVRLSQRVTVPKEQS